MSSLEKIAFFQNIRSEVPNQELARELCETENVQGIAEIAQNLTNKNPNIRSDCLKVMYEIGYVKPGLIKDYVLDFLSLLNSKENRMVWGAFIALANIASLKPAEIWMQIDNVIEKFSNGSVITVVWGVKLFASLIAVNKGYDQKLFPILMDTLEKCIPRDVPTHAESILPAINAGNKDAVLLLLNSRSGELSESQYNRYKRVIKKIQAID